MAFVVSGVIPGVCHLTRNGEGTSETETNPMSDEAPTEPVTPPVPAPPPAPAVVAEPAEPKPTETVEFWKQKAREQENRAKSNAEKAQAHDAYVESQKTEAQRLADAAETSKREAALARAEAARYKVAATHGVGADYFDLLGDGDEEAIETRAKRISELLSFGTENAQLKADIEALRAGKTPAQIRPVADLKPGATPTPDPVAEQSYPASWLPQQRKPNN